MQCSGLQRLSPDDLFSMNRSKTSSISNERQEKVVKTYDDDDMTMSDGIPSCSDPAFCKHPPIFCVSMAIFEILMYLCTTVACNGFGIQGYEAATYLYDALLFKSESQYQIWRFVTYAFLHAGIWHLCFNSLVQITVGTLVEIMLGSLPTAYIYFSGILAGSLVTTMYDNEVNLIGASGAVYAMLAAYIVCILASDTYKIGVVCWISAAVVVAICDTIFAISTEYHTNDFFGARTAYAAHFGGAVTGLTLACIFKKQRKDPQPASLVWISAIIFDLLLVVLAIVYTKNFF